MKRKPLSMKRLHVMAAQFLIALGMEKGKAAQDPMLHFLKYVWEHKDADLYGQSILEEEKIKQRKKSTRSQ